jgi:PLP dependent protein
VLIDNLEKIRYRVRTAAEKAGRKADGVRIVAVTKYAPFELVRELLEKRLVDEVGENRVQDAERKKAALGHLAANARWRLIGHLQTNKAKKAVSVFDAVDSVDGVKVAAALDSAAPEGTVLPVLVQVKLTDKETQSGAAPAEVPGLLEALRSFRRLKVEGLMGIAPELDPVEKTRLLRSLRDAHLPGGILSMGMSRDFEVAVEEGADMIRVGSQIFPSASPAKQGGPA